VLRGASIEAKGELVQVGIEELRTDGPLVHFQQPALRKGRDTMNPSKKSRGLNTKRMLLLSGEEDTCGDLGSHTRNVASKMLTTPGYARFLRSTGHSVDTEHPDWVARQIADFLR
jgi:pimeloyl-ACP methyl ester carboxylesterase